MFKATAQAVLLGKTGDAIVSNLSVGVRRQIKAAATEGGHVVSGIWEYASGVDFADWAITAISVPNAAGDMEERIALVPQHEFEVEQDSWTMAGARATGSKRVSLTDIFVPLHRTIAWADVETGTYPGLEVSDGPLLSENVHGKSLCPLVGRACGRRRRSDRRPLCRRGSRKTRTFRNGWRSSLEKAHRKFI